MYDNIVWSQNIYGWQQINTMLFVDDSDVSIDYNCTVEVLIFKNPEIWVSDREKTVFPILYKGTKILEILKSGTTLKIFTHAVANVDCGTWCIKTRSFFLHLEVELHNYTNIAIENQQFHKNINNKDRYHDVIRVLRSLKDSYIFLISVTLLVVLFALTM